MKKLILACLIMSLYACGSKPPPETQYFVLTPNIVNSTGNKTSFNKTIVLEPIKLAAFLDQPGIIMQTDTHQINVAHYHRWAEPIKKNMRRFIVDTLNGSLSFPVMQEAMNFSDDTIVSSLVISINQFNGVTNGTAILSGEWVLVNERTRSLQMKKSFNYKATLANDGYTELVNQLATLLDKLCVDIVNAVK